jgi:hypothetical protein
MKVVRCIEGEDGYESCFVHYDSIVYRIGEMARIFPSEVSDFRKPYDVEIDGFYVGMHMFYPAKIGECYKVLRGLHAYTYYNENVVKLLTTKELFDKSTKYVVLECEIPKGASYYEGHSNVNYSPYQANILSETSYCSDSLRVIREVPVSELL